MDAPKIPTLKSSQKPQVKVRGLETGVTLFDRLKQFKKKDLAFILAGLAVLFMAPLAEHFMMAPESGDSTLGPGMGGKSGSGLFGGNGSSPYETTGGLAQGGPVGGGSDVITPLNVRDPSSLVMGPGAAQQPPTQSVAPATPPLTAPGTGSDSSLRDALAASARGVGAAAKSAKALIPVPKIALAGAGGLRGLSVASGGSSTSASLGPISSSNSLGKASTGGGLSTVRAVPGYRGTASGRGQTQGGNGIEALKKAGDAAGARMNQGGAATALDQAASQAIPNVGNGLGGNGAGGAAGADKPFGGNQGRDGHSVGESLAFLKEKAIQDARIDLWRKEKEENDWTLQTAKWRNEALKTIIAKGAETAAGCFGNLLGGKNCSDPGGPAYSCTSNGRTFDAGAVKDECPKDSFKQGYFKKPDAKRGGNAVEIYECPMSAGAQPVGTGCVPSVSGDGGGGKEGDKKDSAGVGNTAAEQKAQMETMTKLKESCANIDQKLSSVKPSDATNEGTKKAVEYYKTLKVEAGQIVAVRDALFKAPSGDCGATALPGVVGNAATNLRQSALTLAGKDDADTVSAVHDLKELVDKIDARQLDGPAKTIVGPAANAARPAWTAADKIITAARAKFGAISAVSDNAPADVLASGGDAKDKADVSALVGSVKSARTALDTRLKALETTRTNLDVQIKLAESIVTKGSSHDPNVPFLATVITENKDYADTEGRFTGAGGSAVPKGEEKGYNSDAGGVGEGIAAVKKALGEDDSKPDTAKKAVKDYLADKTNAALKTAAETKLGDARKALDGMHGAQSGWLDAIRAATLKEAAGIPKESE